MKLLILIFVVLLFDSKSIAEDGVESSQVQIEVGISQSAEEASLPYVIKNDELSVISNEIKTSKSNIRILIMKKRSTKNKEKLHQIMENLVEAHNLLNERIIKYQKLKNEIKYRYPEKKITKKREYLSLRIQSLEEIEDEVGIDGQLSKLKKRVDKKYLPFLSKKDLEEAKLVSEEREEKKRNKSKDKQIEFVK